MLKKTVYILITIFAISALIFAKDKKGFDSPPPPRQGEKEKKGSDFPLPPPPQGELDNIMFFEKAAIVLTDKQKELIRNCSFKCNEEIKTLNIDIRKYMDEMRNELIKEKPNRETLKTLIQKRKLVEAEIEYLRIERDITILETLTKEQKTKLEQFRNSFMKKKEMRDGVMGKGKK